MSEIDREPVVSRIIEFIHPEGWKFAAGVAGVSILLAFLWSGFLVVGLALAAFCLYFFRNPQRMVPVSPDVIVSPADGRFCFLGPATPPEELGLGDETLLRVSVFMSVFDVHINRAPTVGEVTRIRHRPGKFINAELDKASEDNERMSVVLARGENRIGVVQIAGLIARRIRCWIHEGQVVEQGERFGLIRFGSRVDLYLPKDTEIRVGKGQRAVAGETIIGYLQSGFTSSPAERIETKTGYRVV